MLALACCWGLLEERWRWCQWWRRHQWWRWYLVMLVISLKMGDFGFPIRLVSTAGSTWWLWRCADEEEHLPRMSSVPFFFLHQGFSRFDSHLCSCSLSTAQTYHQLLDFPSLLSTHLTSELPLPIIIIAILFGTSWLTHPRSDLLLAIAIALFSSDFTVLGSWANKYADLCIWNFSKTWILLHTLWFSLGLTLPLPSQPGRQTAAYPWQLTWRWCTLHKQQHNKIATISISENDFF